LDCALMSKSICFFFQAEDGIRDRNVTGVQTCALPIWALEHEPPAVRLDDRVTDREPQARALAWLLGGEERRKHLRSDLVGNPRPDRKSTRLNSSHVSISYAVFCLKKKKKKHERSSEKE